MWTRFHEHQLIDPAGKLSLAMAALLEAHDYAADTRSDAWDFAVSLAAVIQLGLNESDVRWLIRKGFVSHAREISDLDDDCRRFLATSSLIFTERSCFALTGEGVAACRTMFTLPGPIASLDTAHEQSCPCLTPNGSCIRWDRSARKLFVNGTVIKRFRWPALNQETVLSAFQEEGWPARIDDPLPPQGDQDAKRRLGDTIRCLNRNQLAPRIHFHGDGTGEGVTWEMA